MKTFRLLLFTGIIAAMHVSCHSVGDYGITHPYFLHMSFVDAEGNDLIKTLPRGDGPLGTVEAHTVNADQYSLVSSPDLYDMGWGGDIYGWTPVQPLDPYPSLGITPQDYDNPDANNWVVLLEMMSAPWYEGDDFKTITYTLTCPHIFGDDAKHEIITYWREPSSGNGWYSVCYKVEVDGREVSDIAYSNLEQRAVATIVIDR